LFNYTKAELATKAGEMNFIRDTLEKMMRLTDILAYINTNPIMKDCLALKGGTAINLTVFDLPRLSVDIDLDYCATDSRDEMLRTREAITADLKIFLASEDYTLSPLSKNRHSLDSFVLLYRNRGNMRDNIKIEINYSLRSHIFTPEQRKIRSSLTVDDQLVLAVRPIELFAAKINALLSRAAVRDLFDTYNMIITKLFNTEQLLLLRKCIVFYTAVSQEQIPEHYSFEGIEAATLRRIKTDLLPVIQKSVHIDLENMKETVKEFLKQLLQLTDGEQQFLALFREKSYQPELLFSDTGILNNIAHHPMIEWKLQNHGIV